MCCILPMLQFELGTFKISFNFWVTTSFVLMLFMSNDCRATKSAVMDGLQTATALNSRLYSAFNVR